MNSNLTIEEIVLINNLLYAENLGGPKGTFLSPGQEMKTIGDYVKGTLKSSDLIEDDKEYSTGITGSEYKEILAAVNKNQHLKDMIIMQVHIESSDAAAEEALCSTILPITRPSLDLRELREMQSG